MCGAPPRGSARSSVLTFPSHLVCLVLLLCQLLSKNGLSPSARWRKASSCSPSARASCRQTGKPFKLAHERFFLYPTFDHQPGDLVRESHQPELRRALEEGVWSDGEPPLHTFVSGAPLQQPDRVRIRAWAEVTDHFTIVDPRCVDALSPFYVWTPDYAEKRLGWRGRQPLHVLLLRTYRIPRPVTVKVKDEYTGPSAWIELQRELPFEGTPVLSDAEFERASEEIRAITAEAAGQPVLGLDARPPRLA